MCTQQTLHVDKDIIQELASNFGLVSILKNIVLRKQTSVESFGWKDVWCDILHFWLVSENH